MGVWRAARGIAIAPALAAAVLVSAPAAAQLPPLPPAPGLPQPEQPPPERPPPSPPPNPPGPGPGPAPGDVVSYRGNPQHTQAAADESVFGPLQPLWSKDFKAPPSQPLIVGDRVILNVPKPGSSGYGSLVVALDRLTGKEVWRREVAGVYYTAHIAVDSGLVFAVNNDGLVHAFAVADGAQRWTAQVPRALMNAPVAGGGTVYVLGDGGSLHAFAADTGAKRWQASGALDTFRAIPALDSERVYLGEECGSAVAIRRSDGAVVWRRNPPEDCSSGTAPMVIGGKLYTGGTTGYAYDAATGADRGQLPPGMPQAADGDTGFVVRDGLTAFALDGGAARWRFAQGGGSEDLLHPIVAGGTVYTTGQSQRLYTLDRATGAVRDWTPLPYETYSAIGGPMPGMSAGRGVLVATAGTKLHAFEPVLQPPGPTASALGASDFHPYSGRSIAIVGGTGADLRRDGGDDVVLEHDTHPYGRFTRVRTGRTGADGVVFFERLRPLRNTRYRLRLASGGGESRAMEIYAYPRSSSAFRGLGNRRVELRIRMTAAKPFRAGGRTLVVYFNRRGSSRLTRMGAARLAQTGAGSVRTSVRFGLPRRIGSKDFFYWCVRGLRGYGYLDVLTRRCGARTIVDRE